MKISNTIVLGTSSVFTPVAIAFIQDSIIIMLPWLIAMFMVILTDLATGVMKSHKLKIHVSWTTAARETFGKCVVYFSFVMMVAMIDVAASGGAAISKWGCLIVCALEGGSIIGNLFKPYGITLSPKGILKALLKRSPLAIGDEEADEIVKVKEREDRKWNHRKGK